MTLHPKVEGDASDDRRLSINPLYARAAESIDVPKFHLPEGPMLPETAQEIVHDELMLDGNARLNLATFVTTWMEPDAEKLMAECFDKNMIDKDEYPQTAELEMRCVNCFAGCGTPRRRGRPSVARQPARARPACSAGWRSSVAGSTRGVRRARVPSGRTWSWA